MADAPRSAPPAPARESSNPTFFGSLDARADRWLPMWRVAGLIFVAYPIVHIIVAPPEPLVAVLALAATAIFAYLIWALARRGPNDAARMSALYTILDVVLLGLATVIVSRSPDQGWIALFYFASTAASMLLPERRALALIGLAGVVAAVSLTATEDIADALVQGLAISIIGITVFAMTALRRTNAKLYEARQELAALAVEEERNRIARDLHDVLGHSLSVIAIKSELAGRLLPGDPDRARVEIADVERVARESLGSVRETVSGYRQPTLDRELANARVVLDAAGIESTIDHDVGPLPAAEDAVLAWALREAVTNVVRHSSARHGTIRTVRRGEQAELEVLDDGPSAEDLATGPGASIDGAGLGGLRERLEGAGGRLEAGPRTTGGYRLFATIPVRPSVAGGS